MSIKINPLNLLEKRRVEFMPVYFEHTDFTFGYNLIDAIDMWIYTNLKGRYFIGKSIKLDEQNSIKHSLRVGFEESKEMSYFMLACPHLKYK